MTVPRPLQPPTIVTLYQGEDWTRQFVYYADAAETVPLVFENPVFQIRKYGKLYATLDSTGNSDGSATVGAGGELDLSLDHTKTVDIPSGIYAFDVFADVAGVRRPLLKAGPIELHVQARSTQDPP